jgi:subtilisin family serine protease
MAKSSKPRRISKPKESDVPSDLLRVAITFPRSRDAIGPKSYGARIGLDEVADFIPARQTLSAGLEELERRGLQMTVQGRLTASVRCRRRDFEKLFGTELSVFEAPPPPDKGPAIPRFYYPGPEAPWKPHKALEGLIEDAYIQWPHIRMNQRFSRGAPQPIPPQVGYHHLRVPGDVAMTANAARVHREGITGAGVRVAMIDSGFAHGHSYFQEMGYNTSTVLAPGASHIDDDGNGHGTGESANLLAIAPDCTFIGVKLDNETNPFLGATILEGLQEALRHSPDIISVSLGFDLVQPGPGRKHLSFLPNSLVALEAEIQAAVADGIVVVFSAGNGHVAFPGMMPEVISAGGVYVDEDGRMSASDYASAFRSRIYTGRSVPDFCGLVGLAGNHADYIMLPIPPRCEIDRGNSAHDETAADDGWGVFSGTSAAAPQLAGVCALLLEANPSLTPGDVMAVLRRSARDVIHGQANAASNEGKALRAGPGSDSATGSGLVDAFAAFRQV